MCQIQPPNTFVSDQCPRCLYISNLLEMVKPLIYPTFSSETKAQFSWFARYLKSNPSFSILLLYRRMTTIPHPEFTLSRLAASSTGAVLADDTKTLIDCFHRDFISFISIAQFHKVDFLPITWNIGLEVLGDGATGEVKQSVVNLKNSFAFKLFKNKDKDSLFRELISEVVLLRQPSIFRHPNIINLEGMAFEVDQDSGEIWPVLVFKKAEFGSLRSFMNSGGGKDISFDRKLKLCSEIGSAIMAMHASG